MKSQLFIGPLAHSNERGELIIINHAAIRVENGKITKLISNPKFNELKADCVTILGNGKFLVPGFIDCHIHAVQFPNIGLGYDKDLLGWLETYTFPLEKRFTDDKLAERVFNAVVKYTLAAGTTTACYFASLYTKTSMILARVVATHKQRAFIGKINMNIERNDGYYEGTEDSIKNTVQFIKEISNIRSPLIKPIITPRFALSCNMELMKELGKLVKENRLHVQTHISENLDEIQAVKDTYPNFPSYASVYDAAGLLTNKTVLAHGVHLTDDEIVLLKEKNTAVIHCPSSNTCLKSGMCDVQKLKNSGIKVGLGTDVAGGQSFSMLDVMKSALQVSSHFAILKSNYKALNFKDVFHMATLGGATSLAIDDQVGNFAIGKQFDALIVDMGINDGLLDDMINYNLEQKLERFIYSGDDRNIVEVYVSGSKVK